MNKDKAIQLLERLQDPEPYEPVLTKDAYDAIQMAIDALSADCDTISREAAIEALGELATFTDECSEHTWMYTDDVYKTIKQLPPIQPTPDQNGDLWITVPDIDKVTRVFVQESKSKFCRILYEEQPERIKGHWVKISPANIYECSECGKSVMTNDICAYGFCHGCGADMRATVPDIDDVTCENCYYSERFVDGLILCRRTKTSHRVSATSTCGKGKREVTT